MVQCVVRLELLAQTFLLVPHIVVHDSLVAVIVGSLECVADLQRAKSLFVRLVAP